MTCKQSNSGATFYALKSGNITRLLIKAFITLTTLLTATVSFARPEYALRIHNNRCTNCHYSPAGGGPRNMNGKYYGARGFQLSPFAAQPYAGADLKWLFYSPEKHSRSKGGMAVMALSPWAALPVYRNQTFEAHVVAEHNIGGFSASGPRNLYLRYQNTDPYATGLLPQTIVIGRFIPAFGYMTDEHDVYVRLQTLSTWNMGIRMGAMISGNVIESLHYDVTLLNGQENSGQTLQRGEQSQFGGLINLRFLPQTKWPFMLGLSAAFYDALPADPDTPQTAGDLSRSSQSAYAALSLHETTRGWLPVTLMGEFALAKNMNTPSWTGKFISNPSTYDVTGAASKGSFIQANIDLSQRWMLIYRYDRLTLDTNFSGDVYQRHSMGFKHFFGPNMWMQLRFDRATSSHPGEESGTGLGGNDAAWALMSVNL